MSKTEETSDQITENPLIIYLNRLQRQMIIITDLLYNANTNVNQLKRRILGLIHNLPPQASNKFTQIIDTLKSSKYISVNDLSEYYSNIHGWVYTQLLKESNFGLTMTAALEGKIDSPVAEPLDPKQTSRI